MKTTRKDADDFCYSDGRYSRADCAESWSLWCDALGINERIKNDECYEHFISTTIEGKIAYLEQTCDFGFFSDDDGID